VCTLCASERLSTLDSLTRKRESGVDLNRLEGYRKRAGTSSRKSFFDRPGRDKNSGTAQALKGACGRPLFRSKRLLLAAPERAQRQQTTAQQGQGSRLGNAADAAEKLEGLRTSAEALA